MVDVLFDYTFFFIISLMIADCYNFDIIVFTKVS